MNFNTYTVVQFQTAYNWNHNKDVHHTSLNIWFLGIAVAIETDHSCLKPGAKELHEEMNMLPQIYEWVLVAIRETVTRIKLALNENA